MALMRTNAAEVLDLAVALAIAACRAGYSIYLTSLDDMVRHLKAAEDPGRHRS